MSIKKLFVSEISEREFEVLSFSKLDTGKIGFLIEDLEDEQYTIFIALSKDDIIEMIKDLEEMIK